MSDINKAKLIKQFKFFCENMRWNTTSDKNGCNYYALDNYNGYKIIYITDKHGETTPFGNDRYPKKEMFNILYFANQVLREKKQGIYK